jgi:DNA replication and repair protein RecF
LFVTALQLVDFRNYESVDLTLTTGVSVFLGANGQGKTNLIEAVEYLATLGSHRVGSEHPLIRRGAETALVRARIQAGIADDRSLLAEVELIPGKSNRAAINRSPLRRPRELLGSLKVVLFSPEDLAIVKGDPGDRRRFLDEVATARWPRLAGVRSDYERVLRQRSTLLKSLGGRSPGAEAETTLAIWSESLAKLGAEITSARVTVLSELQPFLAAAYAGIAPTAGEASGEYRSAAGVDGGLAPDELAAALLDKMEERRRDELARGVSLVGPHRDDLLLSIGDFPAKGYASHGESWSLACALKLASFELLRDDGLQPVLLLDDVFAELDQDRRKQLAATALTAEQVLITAAVEQDVPAELSGAKFQVAAGAVTAVEGAAA